MVSFGAAVAVDIGATETRFAHFFEGCLVISSIFFRTSRRVSLVGLDLRLVLRELPVEVLLDDVREEWRDSIRRSILFWITSICLAKAEKSGGTAWFGIWTDGIWPEVLGGSGCSITFSISAYFSSCCLVVRSFGNGALGLAPSGRIGGMSGTANFSLSCIVFRGPAKRSPLVME